MDGKLRALVKRQTCFSSVLRAFADVLDVAGAVVGRDQIIMFVAVFDAHPASTVSDLAKRIASLRGSGPTGSPSLGEVARLLSALKNLLNKTAKTSLLTDVNAIEKLLHDRASMEIGAFVRMTIEAAVPRRPTGKRGAPGVRDDLVIH